MRYVVPHLLRDSAERFGDRIAVVDGDRSLTYAGLDERSDRLAGLLGSLGVAKRDRIGILLAKSLEAIIGVYGAMKSGGAYVPLDPRAPAARLSYIARDCDIRVVLTETSKIETVQAMIAGGAPIDAVIELRGDGSAELSTEIRRVGTAELEAYVAASRSVDVIDLDLAYILYTSGSTGQPKGVKLSHRNALTFVEWATLACDLTERDRLSSHAPLHFDLSVFDFYAAALAGASVTLVPSEASVFPAQLASFIVDAGITVWYSVPSILTLLVLRGGLRDRDLARLRVVLFAGEVFPTKYLRGLMEAIPHARFLNLYGPTETNVCTYYEVPALDPNDDTPIPIGRAIDNVDAFVNASDDDNVGELLVRGGTVMEGYWGDEEGTRARLIQDPRGETCDLVYRTGDLVRPREDGTLEFLGRRDSQVKTRGHRVELGEIEAALYAHPDVLECAVTAVPDEVFTSRLRADVVVRGALDQSVLVSFCVERLPHYMIPETFAFHAELPKTSTGKIDRQALVVSV
jgi:amino acid adenylation domain-containing protein